MTNLFEYDVFISFSSADEEIAKPIWQELCSSGLRVFWSDSTLKKEVGNSWFEVIEKSLERSRHMLLICSDASMNSKWVQREFRAFFDYCYSANSRRLIPLLTRDFKPSNLPLFLRQIQVGKLNDPQFIQEIIPILGGVNIEKLQHELQSLREQVNLLSIENETFRKKSKAKAKKVEAPTQENIVAKEQLAKLSTENASLKEQIASLVSEGNALRETLQERENSLWSENILLKEQIAEPVSESSVLKETLQERENSFWSENILLKEQIAKLVSESSVLKETLQERENSLSIENISLKEQIAKLNKENKFQLEGASDALTASSTNIKSEKQTEVAKESAIKPAKDVVANLPIKGSLVPSLDDVQKKEEQRVKREKAQAYFRERGWCEVCGTKLNIFSKLSGETLCSKHRR